MAVLTRFWKIRELIAGTVAVNEILKDYDVSAKDPFRLMMKLKSVLKIIVEKLNKTIHDLRQ